MIFSFWALLPNLLGIICCLFVSGLLKQIQVFLKAIPSFDGDFAEISLGAGG